MLLYKYLLCRVLLPCCKHLFIPEDLSPACRSSLKELAERSRITTCHVQLVSITHNNARCFVFHSSIVHLLCKHQHTLFVCLKEIK